MSIARFNRPERLSTAPPFSLLRLSAAARLGGVLILLAVLWSLVYWALH